MDYEKAYKEAFERAKDLHDNHALGKPFIYKTCEDIFPELRESEDEKIRNLLIDIFTRAADTGGKIYVEGITYKQVIAWLKKQGEKSTTHKFKIGDVIKYVGDRAEFAREEYEIKEVLNDDDCYFTTCGTYIPFKFEEYYILVEQKPAWSEEDEERISRIVSFIWKNRKGDTDEIYQQEQDAEWLKSLKFNHWKPRVQGDEWVNTVDDACDKRYNEEYSHGEYCHEQSFKWGFQEGVLFAEERLAEN